MTNAVISLNMSHLGSCSKSRLFYVFHYKFTPIVIYLLKKHWSVPSENNLINIFRKVRNYKKQNFHLVRNDMILIICLWWFKLVPHIKYALLYDHTIFHFKNRSHMSNTLPFLLWLMHDRYWKIARLWLFCVYVTFCGWTTVIEPFGVDVLEGRAWWGFFKIWRSYTTIFRPITQT